ncbi:hypothetical protein PG994_006164 [Apiospora phragmitis]|uniref:Uncharacterized protein n=1 Tax=Apiospora phragmitis TaxID=2905665 RepID=A0ABR1VED5_9PEZI
MAQQDDPWHSESTMARTPQGLSHKVSEISESPYDEHSPSRIKGRDSLVSMQSHYESSTLGIPSHSGSIWSTPLRSPAGYQPLDRADDSPPRHARRKSLRARSQDTLIEDESYDMSLLKAAAPIAASESQPVGSEEDYGSLYDVTSFSGPTGAQDEEFQKLLQKQEASGRLTGGIGAGDVPKTQIKSDMLLATSPTVKRSFSRSLTLKRKATTRKEAIKGLGQIEANKTGAVIEVIIEEPADEQSGVDLSNMVGPTPLGVDPNRMRQTTFPKSNKNTEIFYPQPNWKPFSMRWPYLLALILLSLLLAVGVQLIYQSSTREPLMRFTTPEDINPFDYFVLRFVPTLVTVTYGVLWQITDVEVQRLEAFYQMSKDGGALAAESVNVDYITIFGFSRPFRAFQRKHYAVAVSSIATLLAVSLVPTLGAASIIMIPDRTTRLEFPLKEKTIIMSAVLSRLLTSTFVIIAALGCVLFYQLHSRRSGLLADVKGIAGLASMAVVSHVMMDFKDMDVAKPKDIHHKLKNHRYVLRNSSLAPDDSSPKTTEGSEKHREIDVSENPHPLMLRAEGGVPFIIGILLFLAFVPIVLFTDANELTDKAPWVVTALAVTIKLAWGSLETSIRMMEPYYILSKRHAPAKTLALDYTAMPFAWVALRALLNRHWMVFLVGFGTVLAETLTIFVTSLATVSGRDFLDQAGKNRDGGDSGHSPRTGNAINSGQETVVSFTVSLTLTCFILLYMFVVATIVFVRRRHPFLPRQPNTISSVLAFMHQSKMLYDFVGTAKLTNAEMARKLESLGKTYGLGWFEGRDGQTHCGVDEEELTSSYKHGIDYTRGNKPWDREWQLF